MEVWTSEGNPHAETIACDFAHGGERTEGRKLLAMAAIMN